MKALATLGRLMSIIAGLVGPAAIGFSASDFQEPRSREPGLLAKLLVLPFAIGFTIAALACLAYSVILVVWRIVGVSTGDEPPSLGLVVVVAAVSLVLAGAFAGVAATLWRFVLGKRAALLPPTGHRSRGR